MKMEFTGRHIEITEPLRKFASDRLERMRGVADDVMEAHFILTVEKHQRHIAEINLKAKHEFHHGEEVSTDMYTSIAAVLDKIEKQLLKSKGRNISRKRRSAQDLGVVAAASASEAEQDIGQQLPRIVRTHEVAAKPMNIDDAAMAFEESDHEFLVFRNAENQRINIIYKRKDGNLGWIEPEA